MIFTGITSINLLFTIHPKQYLVEQMIVLQSVLHKCKKHKKWDHMKYA
jgi:hypothetical protein